MKKSVILVFILLWSAITVGAVSLRVCETDSNTPFDSNMPIMVGTKLTIYVDSNIAVTDWGGGLDIIKPITDPNPPIGKVFGRRWDSQALNYVGSHFPAAGDRAKAVDWENQDQQSFELSVAGQNKAAGTWFVFDYNAMNIGDCTIKLVEYRGSEILPITSETFRQVATRDFNHDAKVDFADFARLASYWLHTDCAKLSNCEGTDLNLDHKIDFIDVMYFADYWLGQKQKRGEFFAGAGMNGNAASAGMSGLAGQTVSLLDAQTEAGSEQLMMVDESNAPKIYLVYDGNMTPDQNTEITVYVRTDTPLFIMEVVANVTGDANIVSAMNPVDCKQYGWETSWNIEPYIDDVNDWAYFGGVSWPAEANGVVGYFKFRYNSGQVSISIENGGSTVDTNSQPVPFSAEPLIFGRGQ